MTEGGADRVRMLATRGSPLARAQAEEAARTFSEAVPGMDFRLMVVRTTGDKYQKASLAQSGKSLPKGLFTKELEEALLRGEAMAAVHSLKDLPTELPDGLELAAVLPREDVRDVLIVSDPDVAGLDDLPEGAVVATSSIRRREMLRVRRPDLTLPEIRGSVATRLRKLSESEELHGTLLAMAGLRRLGYSTGADGLLVGDDVPEGLRVIALGSDVMLPCVGQGAIAVEISEGDDEARVLCAKVNHAPTWAAVVAERAFLRAMGGGCQSPVGALGDVDGDRLRLRIAWVDPRGGVVRAEDSGAVVDAEEVGRELALRVRGGVDRNGDG